MKPKTLIVMLISLLTLVMVGATAVLLIQRDFPGAFIAALLALRTAGALLQINSKELAIGT